MATSSSEGSVFVPEVEVHRARAFEALVEGPAPTPAPVAEAEPAGPVQAERLRAEARRAAEELAARQESFLAALAEELRVDRTEAAAETARQALSLSLAVAERIVRREVEVDEEALERLLRDLVIKTAEARHLRLRVHPQDAARLRARPEVLAELRVADLLSDPRISRGGCLIEADRTRFDATLEGRFEQVRSALDALLERP